MASSSLISTVNGYENYIQVHGVDEQVIDAYIQAVILVGAQKFHKEELGYNPDNEGEKEQQLGKVYAMLDDYFDGEDADVQVLYNALLAELLENGFLSKLLKADQKEAEKKTPRKK